MKTLIFMAIFFSGSVTCSMNSTENRQDLIELDDFDSSHEEIARLDACLNMLHHEGELGDIASQKAYEAFMAIAHNNFPIISNKSMSRLAYYSLAYQNPGTDEYIVDDCKIRLWNKYRSKQKI